LPAQAARVTSPPTAPQENQLRLRVSIKISVRDPTLLIVRRLDEGKAPPAGAREGWLVMADPTSIDAAPSNDKSVR
jgi:hypothetical protein